VDVARARAGQRDDAAAADEFARASALAPAEEQVLSAQATFLESRRRIAEARELQLRILSRRPDAPEALAALGRLALHAGDPDAASAYAGKLRQLAQEMTAESTSAREDDKRELAQGLFRLAIPLLTAR
jgi:Tfp pilus assembly protein PilF